jgi:hypothetical protein
LFGVLPSELKKLPLSEFQVLVRYYIKSRKELEEVSEQSDSGAPTDGVVIG